MVTIAKSHVASSAASRLVGQIVFDQEFSRLREELILLYKRTEVSNPEKEAFQDAFYSFLTQLESSKIKAFSY